jgi:hypothetical protein
MFEKVKHEKLRPDTCPQDSEITGGKREGEDWPKARYDPECFPVRTEGILDWHTDRG